MTEGALSGRRQPFVISFSGQYCCGALSSRKISMSLGLSAQRGLHEAYTTIHNAPVRHLALCNILRVYAIEWRFTSEKLTSKAPSMSKFWTYSSASSVKEVSLMSCLGHVSRLPHFDWGVLMTAGWMFLGQESRLQRQVQVTLTIISVDTLDKNPTLKFIELKAQ